MSVAKFSEEYQTIVNLAPAISTAIAQRCWASLSFWSTNLLPLASNGCIRCECKRTSIHSFAHYLPDTSGTIILACAGTDA